MRVERLCILAKSSALGGDEVDSETVEGAKALADYSLAKCERLKLVTDEQVTESIGTGNDLKHKVGAYIICHGANGRIDYGNQGATAAVADLKRHLGDKDFLALEKICLLICAVMPGAEDWKNVSENAPGDPDDLGIQINQGTAVLSLLEELKGQGCHPMVAGYDSFVSILSTATIPNKPKKRKYIGDSTVGQKFFGGMRMPDRRPNHKANKRVFRVLDDGKVHVVDHDTWSDK